MSNAPLPSQVDIRKLVAKGAEIRVETPVSSLPRFVDMLASDGSSVSVDLRFYIDEERIRRLDGHLSATVDVYCQRCLEPMPLELSTDFTLGIVWSEEDAKRLPSSLDPLVVGEELVDLADVVSDELILSMPYVSYHPPGLCKQPANYAADGDLTSIAGDLPETTDQKDNPFKVLEQLKLNK